jgi:hypothetical protein
MEIEKFALIFINFCSYNFIPYFAFWNLLKKGAFPVINGKELSPTVESLSAEYFKRLIR